MSEQSATVVSELTEQVTYPQLPGKRAAAPFDRSDADFVLRTADNIEFRVHRLILSLASSVFEGMFSIPKPPALSPDRDIPGISIPEDSQALDLFLRICYPLIDPEVPTLPLLRKVLVAGLKYDAPIVINAMKKELRQARFMSDDPLRVFAIACLYDMEEEAQIAAEKAVVKDVVTTSSCPELDEISAGVYSRLLKLNRTRTRIKRLKPTTYGVAFTGILPLCRTSHTEPVRTQGPLSAVLYPFTPLDGADIILRTTDSLDFFVHRAIITFASPTVFLDTLLQEKTSERSDQDSDTEDERPVYLVPEDSNTLDILLRMCYPVDHPHIGSADVYLGVAFAAHKWGFRKVEQALLRSWSEYSHRAPLRFYFAAVQCGWQAEAKACALQLAITHSPCDMDNAYVPEMESTSSLPYRRLLSYAQACRKAATIEFQLNNLPGRQCPPSSGCHIRYPTTVSTSSVPSWLFPQFSNLQRGLASKPSAIVLTSHFTTGTIISTAMTTDAHCCDGTPTPLEPPRSLVATARLPSVVPTTPTSVTAPLPLCSSDSKIEWVIDLLKKYAAAVDKAVSEVKLEMA
ncbi:hypothetical protein C8T65DRAFT_746772 [Cerioporus squamosus]|nr:hypothetical protein C8T65DRAFT_746772 [Cerioporus squamosus]